MTGHPVYMSQIAGWMLSHCPFPMGRANGLHIAGPVSEAEPANRSGGIVAARHSACPDFPDMPGQETAPATGESADHRAVVGDDHTRPATGSAALVAGTSYPPPPVRNGSRLDSCGAKTAQRLPVFSVSKIALGVVFRGPR